MPKVSDLVGRKVFRPKPSRRAQDACARLGKVHMAVFSPGGSRLVGFTVKQPDVAGMVRRPDLFVALDSWRPTEGGLLVTNGKDSYDERARSRLGIDWDRCIMWTGMDARTVSGRALGYVSDVEFDSQTGSVSSFLVGDGSVAQSLVGSIAVPAAMVRGHEDGFMVVDNAAAQLRPTGGAAAAAGEASAKARVQGAKAARGAGKAASSAVDRGSHALGRALGKAKRALEDASADEGEVQGQLPATAAQNVNVGGPQASGRLHRSPEERAGESPRTYRPAGSAARGGSAPAEKPATKAKKAPARKVAPQSGGQGLDAARVVGRQLGRTKGMFGSFMDEYKKASK